MHKNIRISTTIERPNERIITTYQNYSRKSGITDSFYSLRKTNVNIAPKEFKINTNNKYLICNTKIFLAQVIQKKYIQIINYLIKIIF